METIQSKTLGVVDWIFFTLLLVVSLGIGIYSALKGRGNDSVQEYVLGGRKMPFYPVAVSLLGGAISAISMLGLSSEMYFYGTQLSLSLVGFSFGTLVVQHVLLPLLYPLNIVSLNEYILMRFESKTLYKIATVISLLNNLSQMALFLYAPSLTLSTVTDIPTWASVILMGIVCTFYITIGGVKAVVYADVVQTTLMLIGVLVVVILCCIELGGVGHIFLIANEGNRLEFFNMDPNPLVRHTFWSVNIWGVYAMVSWVGLSQPTFQRYTSVSTLKASKRLCVAFLIGLYILWLTFYFSGIVAYAIYKDCDPLTSGRIEKPDQILPYLALDKLSHLTGLAGIFVAAVYGGVLSSVSSTGHSTACVLWQDILRDLKMFEGISDSGATKVIKVISAVSGIVGIGLGIIAGKLGNIFQVTASVTQTFSGSLNGIFILGICTPWVNRKGVYAGLLVSISFNFWLVGGQLMKGLGSPEKLPLSVEGCPENLIDAYNSTGISIINDTAHSPDFTNLVVDVDPLNSSLYPTISPNESHIDLSEMEKGFYNISYCYIGTIGIFINIIVGSIVSFLTGPIHPKHVQKRLVSPRCLSMYINLWKIFMPKDDVALENGENQLDDMSAIPMVDTQK